MSAVYPPLGPWWTLDAPSLRLPTGDGGPVSIWTVGDGPSILLVPRTDEDHRAWLPLLPHLQERFTLHALQRPHPGDPTTAARDVALALDGLGVRRVVADGDVAAGVLHVLGSRRWPSVAVLHAAPAAAVTAPGPAVALHLVGAPAARLGDDPGALAARLLELLG